MTIASFFAGIGGLELGLERAGLGPTVFQCERDPYAVSVLERHWPGVQRHDDITALQPQDIPQATVWAGGFPCQDISLAGKGAGIHDGERSSLWWAWFELIRVVRPRVLVVENVAAFTARGLGDVLGALAEVGFDAEWHALSAADVGAPHLRRRIFVIAYLADAECMRELQPQGGESDERGRAGDGGSAHPNPRRELLEGRGPSGAVDGPQQGHHAEWWAVEPDVGRVAHGVPKRVDRLRCLGNAVVPQCAEVIGRRVMEIMGW